MRAASEPLISKLHTRNGVRECVPAHRTADAARTREVAERRRPAVLKARNACAREAAEGRARAAPQPRGVRALARGPSGVRASRSETERGAGRERESAPRAPGRGSPSAAVASRVRASSAAALSARSPPRTLVLLPSLSLSPLSSSSVFSSRFAWIHRAPRAAPDARYSRGPRGVTK